MRQAIFLSLFIILACIHGISAAESTVLRGVPKNALDQYLTKNDKFKCLDGSATIPFSRVNDDYCDCPDGSDEPGTSACSPLGKFYCENKGHEGIFIPSSRVNDAVCDCCDGSDEFDGRKECKDVCLEIGREAREKAAEVAKLHAQGADIRDTWAATGKKTVDDALARVKELRAQLEARKTVVDEIEGKKKEAEEKQRKEREEKRKVEEEKRQAEAAKKAEEDAQKAAEEAAAAPPATEPPAAPPADSDKKPEPESVPVDAAPSEQTEPPVDEPIEPVADIPPPAEGDVPGAKDDSTDPLPDGDKPVENGDKFDEDHHDDKFDEHHDDHHEYQDEHRDDHYEDPADAGIPTEFDAVVDELRGEYNTARDKFREIETEIEKMERITQVDFGPDKEFHALHGQCYSLTTAEYTYEFCPYDKTNQKIGYETVSLGIFKGWDQGGHTRMLFHEGQQCWQGPRREAKVDFICGLKNELKTVDEPSRCIYHFNFYTPASCSRKHAQVLSLNLEDGGHE